MRKLLLFVCVVVHERLRRAARSAARAAEFYEKGLKRIDGDWAGTGASAAV